MPTDPANYFQYFTLSPDVRRWGVALTAAGFTRVPAGSPYPPGRHPSDHQFEWERGRVLEALQIVFIPEGRGTFETYDGGRLAVEPGMAFVILPRMWHRYRPDPATGWTESWLEVQGPTTEALLAAGVFSGAAPVRRIAPAAGLEEALERVHVRARVAGPGFDAELAAAAFAVLAAWDKAGRIQPERSRILRAVAEAERQLADGAAKPNNIEALARRLGIAYSHFRRAFKQQTGFAPWQYVLHLRLTRARRLLAAGDATLDDLAGQLGFSSGFHLSSAFKRAYGISPEHWRRQLTRHPAGGLTKQNPNRRKTK